MTDEIISFSAQLKKILEEVESEIKKKEHAQYAAKSLSQYYLNDFMGQSAVKRQDDTSWDGLSKKIYLCISLFTCFKTLYKHIHVGSFKFSPTFFLSNIVTKPNFGQTNKSIFNKLTIEYGYAVNDFSISWLIVGSHFVFRVNLWKLVLNTISYY